MTEKLISYQFNDVAVANPDGSCSMTVDGANIIDGPGPTALGDLQKALDLGTMGKGQVDISALALDLRQFSIRVVFQANGPVAVRQNLVESDLLPFSLFLNGRPDATGQFDLVASVAPTKHGWQAASTRFGSGLKPGVWYTGDLVFDMDTVGVFVDGTIVSVHAFPQGAIKKLRGKSLYLGSWVDGARNHFNGKVAALEVHAGIPVELESQLDERRTHPEWYITYKLESLRKKLDLGSPTGPIAYEPAVDSYFQPYDRGGLSYTDSLGSAFEIHGAIHETYRAMSDRASLGYLVSDEARTTRPIGRKSVFSRGAIYWSPQTRAVPVREQLYLDYEALGESATLGFPLSAARRVTGGLEQEFQGGRMYFKTGDTNAHEVHGAILTKFLALGGVPKWGFPLTHERDLRKGASLIGKYSEFEGCTVYWSSGTGAFEVHGDIRRKYVAELGGPAGQLGLPTSDEEGIPGVAGPGRSNAFQNGSLLWYGSAASMIVARPFTLFIGRISTDEDEGAFMGQNDLYIKVTLKDGSSVVYNKKHPSSGDWGGHNSVDVNLNIPVTITPRAGTPVTLVVDVWESDDGAPFGGGDDHLGKWTKTLDAANGWGLRENGGILDSGSFSKVNSIKVSVKPKVDVGSLSESEKFWGVKNRGTDTLSYQQYATAFSDVDSDAEWWDVTDWLEKAFYELVVQDLADNGNCFGMSLEAINARKGSSLFSLPLNRFTDWNVVRPEFNVKHCYQVGAGPIWWFVKEFLTGNTHDPKDVFTRTQTEFARGNNPVLCISQKYDFSGAPHCILPVSWDSSSKPWRITICDPNFPNALKTLTVNPDANTFEYKAGNNYKGGEWSGGRLHFMPYSLLNSAPRTPIWDAVLLILAGTVIILGEDAETVSIGDRNGNDLDGFGSRAQAELKAGKHLNNFFVQYKGVDAGRRLGQVRPMGLPKSRMRPRTKGTVAGEILLSMRSPSRGVRVGRSGVSSDVVTHLPVEMLKANRALRAVAKTLRDSDVEAAGFRGRTLHHIANDQGLMREIGAEGRRVVAAAVGSGRSGDFRHAVRGLRKGDFRYAAKHGLSEFRLESTLVQSELGGISVDDFGTSKNTVQVVADRDKLVNVEVVQKLGVGKDYVATRVERVPIGSASALLMNLKPGLGGFDIVAGSVPISSTVHIDAVIDGKRVSRRFAVPVDGGVRVNVAPALGENVLGVSRIPALFAPVQDTKIIPGA